jgi:hypothetical protein
VSSMSFLFNKRWIGCEDWWQRVRITTSLITSRTSGEMFAIEILKFGREDQEEILGNGEFVVDD